MCAHAILLEIPCPGSYDIYITLGNEERLFEIKEDTVGNQFTTPPVVPPAYRTVTDIDGNIVQYVGK